MGINGVDLLGNDDALSSECGHCLDDGLIVDLLNGTLLGRACACIYDRDLFCFENAYSITYVSYVQQGISILVFVLLYQFIFYCIQGFIGELPGSHLYWLSSVTSMLLWPWLFVVMRDCRRWFKVA